MDQLQRTALIVAIALAGAPGSAARAPDAQVRLIAEDGGRLHIVNPGREIAVAPVITIEQRDEGGWRKAVEIEAREKCGDTSEKLEDTAVWLKPGQVLSVVPWQGWTCAQQCPQLCALRIYLGPGKFRFVAELLPSGRHIASELFTMPGRPSPPQDVPCPPAAASAGSASREPVAGSPTRSGQSPTPRSMEDFLKLFTCADS